MRILMTAAPWQRGCLPRTHFLANKTLNTGPLAALLSSPRLISSPLVSPPLVPSQHSDKAGTQVAGEKNRTGLYVRSPSWF